VANYIPYDEILACQNFFFRSMSNACFEEDGILACSMGIENSVLNNVLQTALTPDALNLIIPRIETFFEEKGVPWTWLVFPSSQPDNIGIILESRGMKILEEFVVMGQSIPHMLPQITSHKGFIKAVQTDKDFDDWSLVLQEGFESTEAQTFKFRKQTELIPHGEGESFHHYIYYYDNIPVAAATLSWHLSNVRLDNIAVRPQYQRKGFGTAITIHTLKEAKRLNAKKCFLDSSSDGVEMYNKLGFQEYYVGKIYTKKPLVITTK
jgi:ribosomal protein S18 acetylase RimI-like enzyme